MRARSSLVPTESCRDNALAQANAAAFAPVLMNSLDVNADIDLGRLAKCALAFNPGTDLNTLHNSLITPSLKKAFNSD